MSLELHVFIKQALIPDGAAWQRAIDALGFALTLDDSLDQRTNVGFSPAILDGYESGFELFHDRTEELLASYPKLRTAAGDRDAVLVTVQSP